MNPLDLDAVERVTCVFLVSCGVSLAADDLRP
jgi:hypothetical protein